MSRKWLVLVEIEDVDSKLRTPKQIKDNLDIYLDESSDVYTEIRSVVAVKSFPRKIKPEVIKFWLIINRAAAKFMKSIMRDI